MSKYSEQWQGCCYGYLNIFPFSPLLKISITHFYYILTGLYLEPLFTLKIKHPQALHIKYTFLFPHLAKGMLGTRSAHVGKPIALFGRSHLSTLHHLDQCLPLY